MANCSVFITLPELWLYEWSEVNYQKVNKIAEAIKIKSLQVIFAKWALDCNQDGS
jgi:hypothetical protein